MRADQLEQGLKIGDVATLIKRRPRDFEAALREVSEPSYSYSHSYYSYSHYYSHSYSCSYPLR